MNKNIFRIVFNAARGMRMVVQETARSAGKSTTTAGGLGVALSALLGAASAQAQIIGAPNVPGNQRPMVVAAPNGVPLVNIQTPSAAGVSRNVYNRFDIEQRGAILNNSRTNTQTQLGGWVQGNPFLATGPARVILNEINSGSPSQIRGYIEVAGQRAEVIVANPAGIYVDGAGFINASKATLTTGVPQLNAFGGLDGYRVSGGTISIDGKGLDLSETDYAAIYARALQVNAGIWANDLKVVTGSNDISADAAAVTPIAGTGPTPAFALDVAALGGMYSNKIVLVGSEAGLGVRNAGSIGAGAGGLVVTAAGRLENTGTLEGARIELASASDIVNQGTIRQSGTAGLTLTAPTLSNTQGGVIGAEPLNTGGSGSTDGGAGGDTGGDSPGNSTPPASNGSDTGGGTTPSAPATTAPPAPGIITAAGVILNDGGKIYAGGPITLQTPQINNAGGSLSAASMAVTGPVFSNAGGTLNISNGFQANVDHFDNSADGKLTAGSVNIATTGDLNNQDGTIASNGDVSLEVGGSVNNQRGAITATGVLNAAATGIIDNSGGRLAGNGQDQLLQSSGLVNTGGQIEHAGSGTLNITAGSYNGAGGKIIGNGALAVSIAGDFNQDGGSNEDGGIYARQITLDVGSLSNQGGKIVQAGTDATYITAHGTLINSGAIASNGATTLTAGSLTNQGGSIHAAGASDLSINTAGLLDNSADGDIGAGGNLALSAGSLVNDSGRITAVGDLTATVVTAASNVAGTIAANNNTAISAASLDTTRGTITAVNGDLLVTTVGATVNSGGTMQAGGNVALTNSGLDNTAGKVLGDALAIDTRGNALTNTRGTLAGAANVALNSGVLVNDAGLIQSGGAMTVDTNGHALSNVNAADHTGGQGGITSAGTLDLNTGSIDNTTGYIGSKGALTANTGAFSNTGGGVVLSQSDLAIDTHGTTYKNSSGQTQAVGNLTLSAGDIANSSGLIRSAGTTTLSAGTITNTNTQGTDQGIEGQNVALNVGNLDNTSGAIRSDVNTTITSGGNLNNTSGLISAGDTLRVVDPNAANPADKTLSLTNTNGTLVANESLTLDAANFSGDGAVTSGKDLRIALVQDIVNNGEVSANGNVSYTTLGTLTNNGKLLAGGTLTAGGSTVENTANAEMSGADTHIVAGTLNNRGLIDSHGQTRIEAGTVNNIATGRIYGDAVAIGADTLNNDAELVNGEVKSATIASRSTLLIGADTINNRDGSLIFSVDKMSIGGSLDGDQVTGYGSVLNNLSASIESLGDMSIATGVVNNFDTHLVIGQTQETGPLVTTVIPTGGFEAPRSRFILDPDDRYTWYINDDGTLTPLGRGWIEKHRSTSTTTDYVVDSAPSRLVAGGDMSIDGLLRNHDSKVLAGGSFTSTQIPDPYPSPAQKVTRVEGWDVSISGFDTSGNSDYTTFPSHLIEQRVDSIDLGGFEFKENLNATQGYDPGAASNVNGPGGSAGRAGGVSGGSGPGAVIEVASAVNGAAAGGNRDTPPVVRTSAPDTSVPSASLFGLRSGGNYLIETDPRFANYRNWLSSDYLLNAMGFDPNSVQKRLGDGFYEQKLIREQVAQLTGYRYLEGFGNDEEQYVALMNAGATFAQKYHLTPGIALTAEQMAQLTSDIVWLVEQTVTRPDGSTQKVLVPQVYVRVQPGDIDGSGALLSADQTIIKGAPGAGDLTNSGTIAGRSLVSITADNVNNLGGRISGGNVALNARADINVIGGTVDARDALVVNAGNDINVRTTTNSTQTPQASATYIDRVAGLYVTNPGGALIASAGRDVNLVAAEVVSAGSVGVGAGRNVNLGTVTESRSNAVVFNALNGYSESQSVDIGSAIQGAGDVRLAAGNDLNIKASSVASLDGALVASAGHDINIQAGQANESKTSYSHAESKKLLSRSSATDFNSSSVTEVLSSSLSGNTVALVAGNDLNAQAAQLRSEEGMSLSAGRDVNLTTANRTSQEEHASQRSTSSTGLGRALGASTGDVTVMAASGNKKANSQTQSSTTVDAIGTTVSAGSLQVVSGRDTTLQGATVVADRDITMVAGRNLTIESAQSTYTESGAQSGSKSGMVGTWYNPSIGHVKNFEATAQSGTTQVSSQVASLQGDVTLVAGGTYRQTASSVMALGQAGELVGGDVNILAKNVLINGAHNTGQSVGVGRTSSTIMGGSANVGGISTDSIRNAGNTLKAMDDTSDSRMQALGAANLAMSGKQAYDTAQALASGGQLSYGVSVNVSHNKSEYTQFANSSQAVGSGIVAANNVNIVATGGGQDSNIHAIGSTIAAGKTVNLAADNNVTLEASKSTFDSAGRNSSSGANVGVTFGAGAQNGFSIQLGVSQGQGRNNQNDVTYTNTRVSGGEAVNIVSGGDLTMKGAVVEANRVAADVGGNLNIESLQDVSVGSSKQSSSGVNLSLCIPPICYGAVATVSGNAASAKANGVFVSPNEQSGIKAGGGGFDVNVKGNTDLKGAVIESTQAAIDNNRNNFQTGGALTMSDLQNVSQSSGSSYAVSGGVSLGYSTQADSNPSLDPKEGQKAVPPSGGAGVGSYEGNNQASTTKSGISGIAGDQSVRTGDDASPGTLVKDWNTQTIVKDVQAQALITQQFSQNAAREIGTYADRQRDAAIARGDKEEAAKWDEGGEYRVAAHAAAGALSGGVTVALAAGASAALMPNLGEAIADMDLPTPVAQALGAATAAAIGGVVGGAAGAGSAYSIEINNRQLHPTEAKIIKDNAARFAKQLYGTDNPTAEQIETAGSMLATTAQSQLDNNLGYTVLYSEEANNFLQALKIEYMQQNGTLALPDTQGTQQLFYATVDQKNNLSLNQGLADSSVTGLIVRTPLAPSYNNPTNDPTRDKLTGLPLDEQGRYAVQITVDGKTYEPKYFPCATADCVAAKNNYDTSDPATQAYLRAIDKKIMDDVNFGATVTTIVTPIGVAGAIASVLGPLTSIAGGLIAGQPGTAAAKETIQEGSTRYLQAVYGFGEGAAKRITALVDLAGGWQAFIDRVKNENN